MANEISDMESISSSASSTSGSAGSTTEYLKPLSGAKSKVWRYFRFETNEAGVIMNKTGVKCTICKPDIGYCGNTTNLTYHLKRKHPEQFSECCSVRQGSAKAAAASHKYQPIITVFCTQNAIQTWEQTVWNVQKRPGGIHLQRFSTCQHRGECKFLELQQNTWSALPASIAYTFFTYCYSQ